jgi:serine/threonine protein kinase
LNGVASSVLLDCGTLSSSRDLTGALIANKYELLRLIGRGGMGAVYEARNVATLKRCAVKVLLSPELAGDAEVVKRFFREAKASGLIESEHVVAAFDSGIDAADHVYYVMECLHGEDLEQTLGRLGSLNPQAAIKIVLQAAKGLMSAHALDIVHRDVKPANLFLALGPGDEVKVKILDFGVAKVKMEMFNESASSLTHSGSLLGTPLYMSPDQLRRASAIDASADVWSLGVVLFECLTGDLPWGDCDGIGELVTAILTLRLPLIQDQAP